MAGGSRGGGKGGREVGGFKGGGVGGNENGGRGQGLGSGPGSWVRVWARVLGYGCYYLMHCVRRLVRVIKLDETEVEAGLGQKLTRRMNRVRE